MQIKDKALFKKMINDQVNKYIEEFPTYFYGNIFINVFLLVCLIASIIFSVIPGFLYAGIFSMFVVINILRVTFKNFRRNMRILGNIDEGQYDFGLEDYEMDDIVEFMEDLPKSKEEINRLKVSLSFNKLIDILVVTKILYYYKKTYDINLKFKFAYEQALGDGSDLID
jgi:hypothetical protein